MMSAKSEQILGKVAAQTFLVETTRQPPVQQNSSFERRFADARDNRHVGWNPGPHSIWGYVISDAIVDGRFSALWNKAGLILGTGYMVPDDALLQSVIDGSNLVMSPADSTIIIGCNHAYKNYFHWITQALPAIDFSLRREGQVREVALGLPVLQQWQEESLRLLGYGETMRFTMDNETKFYAFKKVEFTELVNGAASFRLSEATRQTYSRLRQAVPKSAREGRKIYVARTDAPSRIMRNESALLDEMRRRGFEIIVPGALTVTEQIRVFREASLVVGPHGAGMTNIVFCEPGTIVYELIPDHYPNICFGNLGLICELRYWADSFKSDGEGHPGARDWDVDLAIVTKRLNEIETIRGDLRQEATGPTFSAMDFLRGSTDQGGDRLDMIRPAEPAPRFGLLRRLLGRRAK